MPVFDNMNMTTSPGLGPSVQDFYNATLQKNLLPSLVHARDAQKVPLPLHNGREVRFRRPVKLAPVTVPLSEGVTPPGQKLEMTAFRVTVKPYGGHIELTDEAGFYLIDYMTKMAAEQLANQAKESLDGILCDAYNAGSNVYYPDSAITSRAGITATHKLTGEVLQRVVRGMEMNNVPKFDDGFYHAIISPSTKYDLMHDPFWTDRATYQDTKLMERNEVGRMAGVAFSETSLAKVFKPATTLFGSTASLTINAVDVPKKRLTLTANHALITPNVALQLAGKLVDVKATSGGTEQETVCIERVEYTDGTSAFVYLRWMPTRVTLAANSVIIPTGGGSGGLHVHSTIVYGKDAFGTVALGGSGDSVEIIMNPPGSSGALDPLSQRGTVGWKAKGFCGVILDDMRICRIEHAVSP